MSSASTPDTPSSLPASLPVSIILESRPSQSRWQSLYWSVAGVVTGEHSDSHEPGMRLIQQQGDISRYLLSGLRITLYKDECESYYHNLRAPTPSVYVVASPTEGGLDAPPRPYAVSLSFDYAHSSLEMDDVVFSVPLPAELYRWSEAYVLEHYVAEKREKRRRKDWRAEDPFTAHREKHHDR